VHLLSTQLDDPWIEGFSDLEPAETRASEDACGFGAISSHKIPNSTLILIQEHGPIPFTSCALSLDI
jgi:hypothetical protein